MNYGQTAQKCDELGGSLLCPFSTGYCISDIRILSYSRMSTGTQHRTTFTRVVRQACPENGKCRQVEGGETDNSEQTRCPAAKEEEPRSKE